MSKHGKTRRANAVKNKRVEDAQDSSSSHTIDNAVQGDFVGLLKMKLRDNGLLDVSIVKRDVCIPM
jgi:hypothetical protein